MYEDTVGKLKGIVLRLVSITLELALCCLPTD